LEIDIEFIEVKKLLKGYVSFPRLSFSRQNPYRISAKKYQFPDKIFINRIAPFVNIDMNITKIKIDKVIHFFSCGRLQKFRNKVSQNQLRCQIGFFQSFDLFAALLLP